MDSEQLAARDRARRMRQMRSAKRQALMLLLGVVIGLAVAFVGWKMRKPAAPPVANPPAKTAAAAAPSAPAVPVEPALPATPANPPVSTAPAPAPAAVPTPARLPDRTDAAPAPKPVPGTLSGATLPAGATATALPMEKVLSSIGIGGKTTSAKLPTVREAKDLLDRLVKTSIISEKMDLVIDKPGLEERMQAFYRERNEREPIVGEQSADIVTELGGQKFLDVAYRHPSSPSGVVHARFIRDERDIVRLDWESFVGYSQVGWKQYREQRPAEPVLLRAFASLDDYHNYEFNDPAKFLSVRLRHLDGSQTLNGFCEKGGSVALRLEARLATAPPSESASGRVWVPVVVKVQFPAKAESDHCVVLLDMVYEQWLAPAGLVE